MAIRIACIPARGGSKGVPRKNIRQLCGKPLIAYTIEAALESNVFTVVAVSSDDDEILRIAELHGAVTVRRPEELATDAAGSIPVMVHCVKEIELRYNIICELAIMLHCTTPLCGAEHMRSAVEFMDISDKPVESIISVCEAHRSPYFNMLEKDRNSGRVSLSKPHEADFRCRQDCPKCYDINGACYVWKREHLLSNPMLIYPNTDIYAMPAENSLDIDTEFDFHLVELVLQSKQEKIAANTQA